MKAIIFDTETTGINEPAIIEAEWVEVNDPFTLSAKREL